MMYILLCLTWYTHVPLCDPLPMSPKISGWIQFCKVTIIFVSCIFIFLTLPIQKRVFWKVVLVVLRGSWWYPSAGGFFHQMVHMYLVLGCGHCQVTQCRGNSPVRYHRIHAVISCISCTQILSEIEAMILVCEKNIESDPRLFDGEIFP